MKKSIKIFIEGEHFISLGLLTMAREKFLEALEINQKNRDEEGIGVCLIYLAQIEIKEKQKTTAQAYLNQAREHYKQRNMEKMLVQLDILQETIDALEQIPETPVIEPTPASPEFENRVDPFELFRMGEIGPAAEIFATEAATFRASGKRRELAISLLYLGQCRFTLGQIEDAQANLGEAREIAQKLQDQEILRAIEGIFVNIELIRQQEELDRLSLQELLQQKLAPEKLLLLVLSKAEIFILKGLSKDAEIAIHEARKLLPQQELEKHLLLIMIVESKLLRLRGKIEQSQKLLKQAREIAENLKEPELVRLVEKSTFEN